MSRAMTSRSGRQKASGSKSPAMRMHPYNRESRAPQLSAQDIVEELRKRPGTPSSVFSDDPLLLESDGSTCEWRRIVPVHPPKQSASTPPLKTPATPAADEIPLEELIAKLSEEPPVPPYMAPANHPTPPPPHSVATSPSCSEAGFAAPAPTRESVHEVGRVSDYFPEDWYGWVPDPEEHVNVAAAMVICRLFLTPRAVAKQRRPSAPEDKLLKSRIEQEIVVPWLKKKYAALYPVPPRRRVSEPLTIICIGYSWQSDDVVRTRRPPRHAPLTAQDIVEYGERNKEQGCWYHRYRCALPDVPEVKDNGSEYDYMLLFMQPMTVPEIWDLWTTGRHEERRRRKHPDWFWSGGYKTERQLMRAWTCWKMGKAGKASMASKASKASEASKAGRADKAPEGLKEAGWAYSSNGTRQAVEEGRAPLSPLSRDPVLSAPGKIMFDIILPPECREAARQPALPPAKSANSPGNRLEVPAGPLSPPATPGPAAELEVPAPGPSTADSARARSPSLELEYLTPPPEQAPKAAAQQNNRPTLSIDTDVVQRPDAGQSPPSPVSPSTSREYGTPTLWPDSAVQGDTTSAEEDHVMDTDHAVDTDHAMDADRAMNTDRAMDVDPTPPRAAMPAPPLPSTTPFCTFTRPPDAAALHAATLDALTRGLHTGILDTLAPGLPGPWLVLSSDAQTLRAALELPGRAMPGACGRAVEGARVVPPGAGGWLEERGARESAAGCAQAVLAGAVGGLAVWCGLSLL